MIDSGAGAPTASSRASPVEDPAGARRSRRVGAVEVIVARRVGGRHAAARRARTEVARWLRLREPRESDGSGTPRRRVRDVAAVCRSSSSTSTSTSSSTPRKSEPRGGRGDSNTVAGSSAPTRSATARSRARRAGGRGGPETVRAGALRECRVGGDGARRAERRKKRGRASVPGGRGRRFLDCVEFARPVTPTIASDERKKKKRHGGRRRKRQRRGRSRDERARARRGPQTDAYDPRRRDYLGRLDSSSGGRRRPSRSE